MGRTLCPQNAIEVDGNDTLLKERTAVSELHVYPLVGRKHSVGLDNESLGIGFAPDRVGQHVLERQVHVVDARASAKVEDAVPGARRALAIHRHRHGEALRISLAAEHDARKSFQDVHVCRAVEYLRQRVFGARHVRGARRAGEAVAVELPHVEVVWHAPVLRYGRQRVTSRLMKIRPVADDGGYTVVWTAPRHPVFGIAPFIVVRDRVTVGQTIANRHGFGDVLERTTRVLAAVLRAVLRALLTHSILNLVAGAVGVATALRRREGRRRSGRRRRQQRRKRGKRRWRGRRRGRRRRRRGRRRFERVQDQPGPQARIGALAVRSVGRIDDDPNVPRQYRRLKTSRFLGASVGVSSEQRASVHRECVVEVGAVRAVPHGVERPPLARVGPSLRDAPVHQHDSLHVEAKVLEARVGLDQPLRARIQAGVAASPEGPAQLAKPRVVVRPGRVPSAGIVVREPAPRRLGARSEPQHVVLERGQHLLDRAGYEEGRSSRIVGEATIHAAARRLKRRRAVRERQAGRARHGRAVLASQAWLTRENKRPSDREDHCFTLKLLQ